MGSVYDKALELKRSGNFSQSILCLTDYIKKNKSILERYDSNEKINNYLYTLGKTYFLAGKYTNSISSYMAMIYFLLDEPSPNPMDTTLKQDFIYFITDRKNFYEDPSNRMRLARFHNWLFQISRHVGYSLVNSGKFANNELSVIITDSNLDSTIKNYADSIQGKPNVGPIDKDLDEKIMFQGTNFVIQHVTKYLLKEEGAVSYNDWLYDALDHGYAATQNNNNTNNTGKVQSTASSGCILPIIMFILLLTVLL